MTSPATGAWVQERPLGPQSYPSSHPATSQQYADALRYDPPPREMGFAEAQSQAPNQPDRLDRGDLPVTVVLVLRYLDGVDLGVRITPWRLINTFILLVFGSIKSIMAFNGDSAANGFDMALGLFWALISYWLSILELERPTIAPWLFDIDFQLPAIYVLVGLLSELFLILYTVWIMLGSNVIASAGVIDDSQTSTELMLGTFCVLVWVVLPLIVLPIAYRGACTWANICPRAPSIALSRRDWNLEYQLQLRSHADLGSPTAIGMVIVVGLAGVTYMIVLALLFAHSGFFSPVTVVAATGAIFLVCYLTAGIYLTIVRNLSAFLAFGGMLIRTFGRWLFQLPRRFWARLRRLYRRESSNTNVLPI